MIQWSDDTLDWKTRNKKKTVDYVMKHVSDGDIILMHDYIGRDSPTPEALRLMIPALVDAGYHFVGVSELLDSN